MHSMGQRIAQFRVQRIDRRTRQAQFMDVAVLGGFNQ